MPHLSTIEGWGFYFAVVRQHYIDWVYSIRNRSTIHKPLGAPDYALPDLPYAFKSLDDYDFIDVEELEHELSEKEKDFKPDKTE